MSNQSDRSAILLQVQKETESPFIIIVDGESASTNFWLNDIHNEIINPIINNMPCPIPGVPRDKRNFRMQIGVTGLTEQFSYYAFADQEVFEKAQEKLSERGYQLTAHAPKI